MEGQSSLQPILIGVGLWIFEHRQGSLGCLNDTQAWRMERANAGCENNGSERTRNTVYFPFFMEVAITAAVTMTFVCVEVVNDG